MSELDNIIQETISLSNSRVTQAGFGTPLILDYHTRYTTNRVREYGDLTEMTDDGFLVTDPAYLAAQMIAQQDPAPPFWKVGRRTLAPSQRFELTPLTAVSTRYGFGVAITGGVAQTCAFTSSATATTTEIVNGLTAAFAALSGYAGAGLTASNQSGVLRVLGPASGPKFEILMYADNTLYSPANFSLFVDVTADAGIATDMNSVMDEDDDWYGVMSTSKGKAEITALAANIETTRKFFVAATMDSAVIDSVATTDIASAEKALTHQRTAILWNDRHMAHPDAAVLGRWLPFTPGSETMMFQTLTGVTPTKLSGTQRTAITTKNANFYNTVGGLNIMEHGVTPSAQFMDTIRYRDWIYANIQQDVLAAFAESAASPGKIPIATDDGLNQIGGVVHNVLIRGEQNGGGVPGSSVVTVPAATALAAADRKARYLNKIKWSQDLAGAIHSAKIDGTLKE